MNEERSSSEVLAELAALAREREMVVAELEKRETKLRALSVKLGEAREILKGSRPEAKVIGAALIKASRGYRTRLKRELELVEQQYRAAEADLENVRERLVSIEDDIRDLEQRRNLDN